MGWKYWMLLGLVLILGFMAGMFYGSSSNTVNQVVDDHLLTTEETAQVGSFIISIHEAYLEETEDEDYVIVDVSFFNESDTNTQLAPMNSSVIDDEGYEYQHDSSFGDQRLMGGQIRPGGQRRGTLAYPVNDVESSFEWVYSNHATGQQGVWDLDLAP
ncbi:DUF4352 domain-containing protein [Geomicrobium sp. JCM 19038]|uniref:DUF4352 domain-containing protein n=1 Tax=Geomicrobium sp. JCM 19038 TaxID=1460635 RepID=UPI00045F36DF|nr:DUF4352 domain-containing protein [Geomicrobium sp. JCM 19038]GAK09059.1 hypothetical protein JCM19038_2875 [Geomicrobium sp. JCM 19038]